MRLSCIHGVSGPASVSLVVPQRTHVSRTQKKDDAGNTFFTQQRSITPDDIERPPSALNARGTLRRNKPVGANLGSLVG